MLPLSLSSSHKCQGLVSQPSNATQEADQKSAKAFSTAITLERGRSSWKGSFSQALERDVKYLKDSDHKEKADCGICREIFQEKEEVTVLPCDHTFHSQCLEKWGKRICPIDRMPEEGVFKISLLGSSLVFPARASSLALSLEEVEKRTLLQSGHPIFLKTLSSKDPKFLAHKASKPELQPEASFIRFVSKCLQDLLNCVEGTLKRERIGKEIDSLMRIIEEEQIVFPFEEILFTGIDWAKENPRIFWTLLSPYIEFEDGIDDAKFLTMIDYLTQLSNDERFREISIDLDVKFFCHNVRELEKLGSDAARYAYLSGIDSLNMSRLERIVTGLFKDRKDQPTLNFIRNFLWRKSMIDSVKRVGNFCATGIRSIFSLRDRWDYISLFLFFYDAFLVFKAYAK